MTKTSKTTPTSGTNQIPFVFFGNEKLVTGGHVEPVILPALAQAGYKVEQVITGELSELKPHQAQIAVLASYGKIIPKRVLDEFPLGIINIHPSLLPAYRGPTPIESAILDGVSKTGVSIMRLTPGMDEGPVYKQRTVHLSGRETKSELAHALQSLGAELLLESLPSIIDNTLSPRQQPHPDRATYSKKITKEDGVLDFTKPAVQLEREVRAYMDWPKSTMRIAEKDVVVLEASVDATAKGDPGTVFRTSDKKVGVYCSEGALIIAKLKPAGKQAMSSEGFLAGYGQSIPLKN
jgi:methionyl-tRNA formyltransferase